METPPLELAEEGDKSVNNANKQNYMFVPTITTPSYTAGGREGRLWGEKTLLAALGENFL